MKKQKLPDRIARNRPNYTAKGMSYTASRSGHALTGDKLTLAVKGTLAAKCNIFGWFKPYTRRVAVAIKDKKPVYALELTAVGKTYYREKTKKPVIVGCYHSLAAPAEKRYTIRLDGRAGKIMAHFAKLDDAEREYYKLLEQLEPKQ